MSEKSPFSCIFHDRESSLFFLVSGRSLPHTPLMSSLVCPMCEMNEIIERPEIWECVTCGHEWARPPEPEKARVVKDAHGTVLADGDIVVLIKDLPLKGSQVLKAGAKSKTIKLVDGDHEISCRVDGINVGLKACFVKKVVS